MFDEVRQILIRQVEAELKRMEEIDRKTRVALMAAFETVPGDPRFCIRRLEAVEHVVKTLGIRVVNNFTFRDVERVAVEFGWEPVKNGGRSLFRCVKRRDLDQDEALVVSRGNRYDPRTSSAGIPADDLPRFGPKGRWAQ
jgi:hypothetical protein